MSADLLWKRDQYQLLDFGNGRKLERFGAVVLDRPSPAADHETPADQTQWTQATVQLGKERSRAGSAQDIPDKWAVAFDSIRLQLRVTPMGHVGLFPEHAFNWRWLVDHTEAVDNPLKRRRLLNLFAYTGGATLVMAARGWESVHVDASAPSVAWARHNAQLSELADAPIRWLVEDARQFAARELRRGRQYDAIVLDPPSYGHGPKGKAWHIDRDLPALLADCCQLLEPGGRIVLTGHSQSIPHNCPNISDLLEASGHRQVESESGRLKLFDLNQRSLDCGWYYRVSSKY